MFKRSRTYREVIDVWRVSLGPRSHARRSRKSGRADDDDDLRATSTTAVNHRSRIGNVAPRRAAAHTQ